MNLLKKSLAGVVALIAVLVGVLLLWGLAEPYVLDDEEQVAALPNLPPAWTGTRFALLADWQVGMWMGNEPTIRRAVARLAEQRPAFVLIAGDFVYHASSGDQAEVEQVARLLRPLAQAGVPVFAVLGNHDYGMQKPDGQVRVPFLPESTWMGYFKSDAVHTDGWIAESYGQRGNRLYVNRGIGFSLAPLRIGARPEVTRFTLQSR